MKTILIIAGSVILLIIVWLHRSAVWIAKQSLLGTWISTYDKAGEKIIIEFEGDKKGGSFRKLIIKDGNEIREFGHWALNLTQLNMIIMASDIENNPKLGEDRRFSVVWEVNGEILIRREDGKKESQYIRYKREEGDSPRKGTALLAR